MRIDFISLTDEAALDDGWSEVESEEEEEDDLEESLDRDPAALDSSDEDEDKPRDSSLSAEERDDNWLQ